jgi:hypothetical protein
VFVVNVNRWTPYYMAAIAPFRHWIIYPALLRRFCKKWDDTFSSWANTIGGPSFPEPIAPSRDDS